MTRDWRRSNGRTFGNKTFRINLNETITFLRNETKRDSVRAFEDKEARVKAGREKQRPVAQSRWIVRSRGGGSS